MIFKGVLLAWFRSCRLIMQKEQDIFGQGFIGFVIVGVKKDCILRIDPVANKN